MRHSRTPTSVTVTLNHAVSGACIVLIGLLISPGAKAQGAVCLTPAGACPMGIGLPPGSFCSCSAMPMLGGRVVVVGGGQINPTYPTADSEDDDDQPPNRHHGKQHKPKPVDTDDDN
jgi:hypothetical protein